MYGINARGLKCVTAVVLGLAVCQPAWGQGRQRGGGGGREGRGGEARVRSEGGRDGGARMVSPRSDSGRATVQREIRDGGGSVLRRDSGAREFSSDDGRRIRSGDRDRDGWRRDGGGWWRRDRDWDDRLAFGFGIGPFSGFYGPRYYYNPWYGYYGPSYGYFGPWSGSYIEEWPYYYDDGIAGSAYYETDVIRTEVPVEDSEVIRRREGTASPEAVEFQRRAESAFRAGRYDEAVRMANHAAVEMPNNGKLFLLLGQALFAVGDYGAAAGAIHKGMAMSDPKNWGAVVQNFRQFYGNANDYTEQLRRLEKFAQERPDAAYARLLLGYHYGFLGYPEEARRELAEAVRIEERDELAGDLLAHFGGKAPRRSSTARDSDRAGDEVERTARQDDRDERGRRDGRNGRSTRQAPMEDERESRAPQEPENTERSAPPPE